MPFQLLVRAEDAPVPDSPGAWRKGDIVSRQDIGYVYGNKETLPKFLRLRITTGNHQVGWLQEDVQGGELVNRRSVRVDPAQVDIIAEPYILETSLPPAPTEVHAEFKLGEFTAKVISRQ